jgi:cytochrome P450
MGHIDGSIDSLFRLRSFDVVSDFALPIATLATLDVLGLEIDDWWEVGIHFHGTVAYNATKREYRLALARRRSVLEAILASASQRSGQARGLVKSLKNAVLDERTLEDSELTDIIVNLLAGGIGTGTALLSWGVYRIGIERALRDSTSSALIGSLVRELLRYYSPAQGLTYTVLADHELGGSWLREGDGILVSWLSAAHDPAVFSNPESFAVGRRDSGSLVFGIGPHRCPGRHLATVVAQDALAALFARMPALEIDVAGAEEYPPNLLVGGLSALPGHVGGRA